ncbi:MAG: glycine cleavage system protein R [Gammaproteobacteria bacterium]|jgi:glycine cleavage system regulatory protein|nr:glycine cleavage system protein R [Gammaproteobacteria bacterium]MBT3860413.1 glycine cleavage system protein R [Gammaproteobacteria bacterium]MBT3988706.1 glycine cleavage system protein R [Gammaproteobacteria bacterium]MBT4255123.1 glycine cleavage system protein R [Gammaproteobacteria bacterium]MBT4581428.1 glycine cleavage system protein R [Gammaproteobacteria bacterium]
MTSNLVLTVIGDDKPGLVEALSVAIANNSGNWLESSMAQLAGKFAGILRVSVPESRADSLISDLNGLSDHLKVVVEKAVENGEEGRSQTAELSLVGNDRPGIIREISKTLSLMSVNVEQLTTECEPAPMSSDLLFKAKASLNIPADTQIEELQSRLEQLADDLIVEIDLS